MLAKDFNKDGSKMNFPVLVQPKLDGMRMIYDSRTNKAISRNGKGDKTQSQTKILAALKSANWHGATLDGELYKHGFNFQQVMRGVATQSVEYHVYDIVSEKPFKQRYAELKSWYDAAPSSLKTLVKLVPTYNANSLSDITRYQDKFLSEKFEGAMVRNPDSPYVHGRTVYLQKFKKFDDDEFKVVGYKPHAAGGVVFECITKSGKTFHAAPSAALKAQTSSNPGKFVGKFLTIQYFGLSESGIPRFPQAKAFRDKSDLSSAHSSPKSSPERTPKSSPYKPKEVKTKSPCPPNKILSPRTGRCINKTSPAHTIKMPGKSAKGCSPQTTKKYLERPSPPYPANECQGETKNGNDGFPYISVANASGVYSWRRLGIDDLHLSGPDEESKKRNRLFFPSPSRIPLKARGVASARARSPSKASGKQCACTIKNGSRCSRNAESGKFCWQHKDCSRLA